MLKLVVLLTVISVALALPQLQNAPILDGRIVGGQDADIRDYSYQLSLQFSSRHICGAATIAPTWALTAAHCVARIPVVSLLTVRAGSSTRNSGGQVVTVLQTVVHPDFWRITVDYDIAALRLSSAISSEYSQPIPLPNAGTGPAAGAIATITGWGITSESSTTMSNTLQVVHIPVIGQSECREAYGVTEITDRMFCAGLLEQGGKDACQGDSGGPVVVSGVLTGFVSWGEGCARRGSPGVFTNLPVLRSWVTSITRL